MLDLTNDSPDINHTFRIQYIDQTYQLVEWTNDQLALVYRDMEAERVVTMVDKCIFRLADIRAITYLPPVVDDDESEEVGEVVVTEMGEYEKELYELLQLNGIDVGQLINKGEGGQL